VVGSRASTNPIPIPILSITNPEGSSMRGWTISLLLAACLLPTRSFSDPRPPAPMDAAAIRLGLRKLGVTGSALYVGAHPDDENTAMIAWLSQGRLVRTAYLSLTRGDGGQNLLGSDVGERLGVIRTQELLDARRIDGGEQMFSRAVDFGFSKNPEETLAKWGHDAILADVVWAIRRFRPDVIIDRFATDGSGGHGHHTASALLGEEAFAAAADSTRFPDQLRWVRPWQAKRLVWNVTRFGQAPPDTTPGRLRIDLGDYSPELGRSFTEIAGESRSMHKSQGDGAPQRRGAAINTFEHRFGERATRDLFDGIDLTWRRFPGGDRIAPLLERAERSFDPDHPERLVPALFELRAAMALLPDAPIVQRRSEELDALIRACSGLWVEAIAAQHSVTPGGGMRVALSVLVRTEATVRVTGVELRAASITGAARELATRSPAWNLTRNVARTDTVVFNVPADLTPQGPYWLGPRSSPNVFEVPDPTLIGTPENPPLFTTRFHLEIDGQSIAYEAPVVYRWVDPVQGDRYRDVVVVPEAAVRFDRTTYLFPDRAPRDVRVSVTSTDHPVTGALTLELPPGWRAAPATMTLTLRGAEAETTVTFQVTPGVATGAATIGAALRAADGTLCNTQLVRLDYPHFPIQTLLPRAEARLVRVDVAHRGATAGYVMGSGDQVNDALAQIGYRVQLLSDDNLERDDLSHIDVIVIGVRAFNTRPRLRGLDRRLLDYVAQGGRLVVQYQTPDRTLDVGPYPFTISNNRVTVEEAEMRLVQSAHALLRSPNLIGPSDFAGWVQERGLSFANPADPRYARVLSSNDPGETPQDGGVLFTHYGKGAFIYTGLAFFRQLPAGVAGAYRLWANLVSPERAR
jgi:LmbE family N-acetylglucosaminyl deacetylase